MIGVEQPGAARPRPGGSPAQPQICPSLCGFRWRGRMGVEPTGAGIADARTVLKTGEATGPLPPPRMLAGSMPSFAGRV